MAAKTIGISASSGLGLDVFGIAPDSSVFHKYYRGFAWEPAAGFESMNGTVPTFAPSALSTAPGTVDYFVVGSDSAAYHKYWDGVSGIWKPAGQYHQRLEGKLASGLATASWAAGRIDLVGKAPDGTYTHMFLNGDDNLAPWENFGKSIPRTPSRLTFLTSR